MKIIIKLTQFWKSSVLAFSKIFNRDIVMFTYLLTDLLCHHHKSWSNQKKKIYKYTYWPLWSNTHPFSGCLQALPLISKHHSPVPLSELTYYSVNYRKWWGQKLDTIYLTHPLTDWYLEIYCMLCSSRGTLKSQTTYNFWSHPFTQYRHTMFCLLYPEWVLVSKTKQDQHSVFAAIHH